MIAFRNIGLTLMATWLCFVVYNLGPWGTICIVGWSFLLYHILSPIDGERKGGSND